MSQTNTELRKRIDTMIAERDAERKMYNDAIACRMKVYEAEVRRLAIECGKAKDEIERLHADNELLAAGHGRPPYVAYELITVKRDELQADNEHLRDIIRDLLWIIGHEDEQALKIATAEARHALENKS